MNQVVLLLGGNIGNVKSVFSETIKLIETLCGKLLLKSNLYESEAWGFSSNNNFLNQAIKIETELSAMDLLKSTQSIELKLGREQKTSIEYQSRLIDIDILFYNSDIINTETLIIPHSKLHLRKFTLDCLMDIIPSYIHPKLKQSIRELHEQCTDTVKVWPYE